MSPPRNLDIFTSPLAFACLCAVLVCLWSAIMLAPAFIVAAWQQPEVVTPAAHAEASR